MIVKLSTPPPPPDRIFKFSERTFYILQVIMFCSHDVDVIAGKQVVLHTPTTSGLCTPLLEEPKALTHFDNRRALEY